MSIKIKKGNYLHPNVLWEFFNLKYEKYRLLLYIIFQIVQNYFGGILNNKTELCQSCSKAQMYKCVAVTKYFTNSSVSNCPILMCSPRLPEVK